MDALIDREAAEALLAPYLDDIAACLDAGFDAWGTVAATAEGRRMSKTARARIIWDHATARAMDLFGGDPSVGVTSARGLVVLDFGAVLLRFKKLDRQLRTRGISTGQQLMFDNQGQVSFEQLTFWRPAPIVVAGYILNQLETAIERRLIVLKRRGQVLWTIDLPSAGSGGGVVAIPQPTGPTAPKPRTLRVVRPEDAEAQ